MSSKVALVMVHGILSDSRAWDPLVGLLERDVDVAEHIRIVRVDYPTKLFELNPKKSLPDLDTVARYLGTQLAEQLAPNQPVVFAAHSQGGLIVQRYLAQQLHEGHGLELRRVRRVLMFATPNSGSEFLLSLRKRWGRNPQELELRPNDQQIIETQKTILNRVVHATEATASSVPIPFEAFAGMADPIVLPQSARSVFPNSGVLPGDHSSIIRPTSADDLVYRIVKARVLQEIQRSEQVPAESPDAVRVAQLGQAVDGEIRSQQVRPPAGYSLRDDAVKAIATALATIPDLNNPIARQQFVMNMPPYIQERLPHGSLNARLDLGALVKICAIFEGTGREALIVCLEWAFVPEDPAVGRALAVIEREWPPGAPLVPPREGDSSHPARAHR